MVFIHINSKSDVPIFAQIAHMLEDHILDGSYEVDEPVLSTTQLSKLLKINPATAIKGVSILVDQGILYKRRGMGMYVSKEAKEIIMETRKQSLKSQTIKSLVEECKKLKISQEDIIDIIKETWHD